MASVSSSEVQNWYNKYVEKQASTGITVRHRTILSNCKKHGLAEDSKVLEIGCGIGTLTQLIAQYVSKGLVFAADISDKSIERAKENLKSFSNVQYAVSDMTDFKSDIKFDYVVLPDVLEHIPIEQHASLFKVIGQVTHDRSKICINLPHPVSVEWHHQNKPELMQIIDQAVHTDEICKNAYPAGWMISFLEEYALHNEQPDYEFIVLKKRLAYQQMTRKSNWELQKQALISKVKS